jgi:hypothetical protein
MKLKNVNVGRRNVTALLTSLVAFLAALFAIVFPTGEAWLGENSDAIGMAITFIATIAAGVAGNLDDEDEPTADA